MQDTFRRQVVYGEKHIIYLQDELDREHSFLLRIQREQKENQRMFRRYRSRTQWLLIAAAVIWVMTQGFKLNAETDALAAIVIIVLGPLFILDAAGLIFCAAKLIHYGKLRKGTRDPRGAGYKPYGEMLAESQSRTKYLERELSQAMVQLEINKNILEGQRQLEGQNEQDYISMDEVYELRGEKN